MKKRDSKSLPIGGEHGRRIQAHVLDHTRRINRVEKKLSSGVTVRTALPQLPNDGQVIYYQNSAMATLGLVWQFRYNASGGTYKWEFTGGGIWTDAVGMSATAETTASTTPTDLATSGPSITVPLAGQYLVTTQCNSRNTVDGSTSYAAVKIGAATASEFDAGVWTTTITFTSGAASRVLTCAASDVLKVQYWVTANTGGWRIRTLQVLPIRVG